MYKFTALLALMCATAHANPVQTTGNGCGAQAYGNSNATQCSQNHQGQQQAQASISGASAQSGAVAGGGYSAATGGSGGAGGEGGSGSATGGSATTGPSAATLSTTNSGNYSYREAAQAVTLPPIFVSGCGTGFGVGGSAIKGSALFDITHISKKCWKMLTAYGMLSAGYPQNACEIYRTSEEGQEAIKAGAAIDCALSPPAVVYVDRPVATPTYTPAQVDKIVRKAVSK